MYAEKGQSPRLAPAARPATCCSRTLRERQPELHAHLPDVAELALAVGRARWT